jgi:hypothetical protein
MIIDKPGSGEWEFGKQPEQAAHYFDQNLGKDTSLLSIDDLATMQCQIWLSYRPSRQFLLLLDCFGGQSSCDISLRISIYLGLEVGIWFCALDISLCWLPMCPPIMLKVQCLSICPSLILCVGSLNFLFSSALEYRVNGLRRVWKEQSGRAARACVNVIHECTRAERDFDPDSNPAGMHFREWI